MNRTANFTELRRELSRTMREPFFRRIGSYRPITVAASNYLADTALGRFDASEGWPYAFAYAPVYGDQREITNFLSDGNIGYAYVSPNWSTTPAAGAQYEIHSIWSAQEKLDALNHAIHDCWPAFYEVATDESIVIEKWQKEYSLNGLAHIPRHLLGVYIEPMWKVDQYIGHTDDTQVFDSVANSTYLGKTLVSVFPNWTYSTANSYEVFVTAGTGSGLYGKVLFGDGETDSSFLLDRVWDVMLDSTSQITVVRVPRSRSDPLENMESILTPGKNWQFETGKTYEVAVYYGAGAGQYRTIVSGDSGVDGFFVTSPWTTALDSTSEFCVKNVSDQSYNWQGPIVRYRVDSPEAPSMIALHWDATEYWGAKLRLIYAYEIEDLTAESSAVPAQASDFLVHMAAYHLWLGNIGRGPQFETKTAEKLAQQNKQDAEELRERNRMKRLTGTIRIELDNYGPAMREKPFSR